MTSGWRKAEESWASHWAVTTLVIMESEKWPLIGQWSTGQPSDWPLSSVTTADCCDLNCEMQPPLWWPVVVSGAEEMVTVILARYLAPCDPFQIFAILTRDNGRQGPQSRRRGRNMTSDKWNYYCRNCRMCGPEYPPQSNKTATSFNWDKLIYLSSERGSYKKIDWRCLYFG